MTLPVLTAPTLSVPHGFLGRQGGVSTGHVAGLNVGLGTGDDPAAIAENRRRAVAAVAPSRRLVTVYQVHGSTAVEAGDWPDDARPHADALVTDRADVALGILTADCAPVLFADADAGVVGAAHAGWKGALGDVVESTIAAMERLGAARANIAAAVGPCIARRSYEVDDAFRDRFIAADPAHEAIFTDAKPGHPRFDLEAFVLSRFHAAGITRATALGEDTYAQPDRFYSFRRATHLAEPDYGRQISLIALP